MLTHEELAEKIGLEMKRLGRGQDAKISFELANKVNLLAESLLNAQLEGLHASTAQTIAVNALVASLAELAISSSLEPKL